MKRCYKLVVFFILIIVSMISSCELYNPAEAIPAYIHIQKIGLSIADTSSSGQGSKSSKISDAWVYVDEQLIGCFELPATIPVLFEGTHKIKIRPGIKVNGIATNRAPYPFYKPIEHDVDLHKGAAITLSLTTTYLPSTVFKYIEDFESVGITIDKTSHSDTTLQLISTPATEVFEGTKSAIAYVDATKTFFECKTLTAKQLPVFGAPVFLEFNYKCNYEFTVSIFANGAVTSEQFLVLHFNASPNWNKTYVYLTPTVSSVSSAIDYNIVWGMLNSTGATNATLSLDNIKLIN